MKLSEANPLTESTCILMGFVSGPNRPDSEGLPPRASLSMCEIGNSVAGCGGLRVCVVGYVGAVGYMGGSCGLCVTVDGAVCREGGGGKARGEAEPG